MVPPVVVSTGETKPAVFKLDRYLPQELLTKLESARARDSMAGERRVVTMLFCDVKGSTAAAERVDPEIWTDIMNGAFEHMIRPIYKYEGLVPRLMGDAILAFFGAPITHEDDPQRAVLAGLEMGGIPVVTVMSQITGLPAAFLRKQPKSYGTCRYAEGADLKNKNVVLVEDVVSSGGAILDAVAALRRDGISPFIALCVIDRQSGGHEFLEKAGISLRSLYTMHEIEEAD